MVYVLNINGQPLMPTKRHGAVRRWLRDGKAKVVKRCPFTIQLLKETTDFTQELTLGVDSGSKTIGLSVTSEKEELFASEVTLRNDIIKLLSKRRESRRTRRSRLRYRKPRFNNRKKDKGWLAPSVQNKINTHLKVIEDVHKILPISKIIVEVASFDIQKIKNPDISGNEYQQGEQLGFWNVREYVLFRDGHVCKCCEGKSKDKILNVHHIESRQTGGNSPDNLITLCETCHNQYHKGLITLPENIKRGMKFNDATFMGIMRWAFYTKLKELYENVSLTYGYITKNNRIKNNLAKTHAIDAYCIAGNLQAKHINKIFIQRKVRCHNRQVYKDNILKGWIKKLNQLPYLVKNYRLYDKVLFNGKECFISGRRSSGSFALKDINWNKITDGVTYRKIKLIETHKNILNKEVAASAPYLKVGVSAA